MKLVIVSGRSGSGKSTALRTLEDAGYHCVDNLPVNLLDDLMARYAAAQGQLSKVAVCIDARSSGLEHFLNCCCDYAIKGSTFRFYTSML